MGTGHTPSRGVAAYWDGPIQWMGIRDARAHHGGQIWNTGQTITQAGLDNSSARLLPAGTVALSRTASVGYVVQLGCEMATSQDFVTWTCGSALEPRFLMRALEAEGDDIRAFGEGSTHTTIYFPELKALHIKAPPAAEQRRIVAKIDSLSAHSSRARSELDTAIRMSRRCKAAILDAAFGSDLIAGGQSMAASWPAVQAGTLIKRFQAGKNLRCEERPPREDERGVVKVSAVTWGTFDPLKSKTLPADYIPPNRDRINSGDLLFSRANTLELVGACVIVQQTPSNLFLSDKILRLETEEDVKPWLLWFFRSGRGRLNLEAVSSGNQHSMRNISQDGLKSIRVPFPDGETRQEIVRRIESSFAAIDRLAAEAQSARALLDKLDQAILAKAFRGELVPQDPNDEPASSMLDRIRTERAAAPAPRRRALRAST